jgi:hypothetical protein
MMMRASASGIEDDDTMGFDGGAVGSDAEAAPLSPADPKISTRLSNGKNRKLFIACLLMDKVFNGRAISNPNSAPKFFTYK